MADVWPGLAETKLGDLDAMVARGEIRVLTTFTLGSYYIDNGKQRGTVYEMSRRLESYARANAGEGAKRLKVTIIPVRRDQLLPHLVAGHGDIAFANLTVTPVREQFVDFSQPFLSDVSELLVTAPGQPPVHSVDDLAGRNVVVPAVSSYFESVIMMNERLIAKGLEPLRITLSDPRLEVEDIIEMLDAGMLPMTVADSHRIKLWSQIYENVVVYEDIVFRENASVALAMRKETPSLRALLNGFVDENQAGTLVANMLITQYTEYTGWARAALENNPSEDLLHMADLFRKYGNQYDFDWLMLASFAFQESGFDQDARSPVGAIGVMQVMPATAADRKVGIEDIDELENNIHAGTKYLSLLRSHYFSDEALEPTEQMLFTMAGYNAGPNRINRLRRDAEARGLDPNVWFNNVELVVAAKVGREPINYVNNIYRYYIVYKRAEQNWEIEERNASHN